MRARIEPATAALVGFAVRHDVEGGREAARQLLRTADLGSLPASTRRLLPLFAGGLPSDGSPAGSAERVLAVLHRQTSFANQRLWRAAREVTGALGAAGIPFMFLKGIALLPAYAWDWGARPMLDADVVVPERSLVPALQVLADLGWTSDSGLSPRTISRRLRWRRHSEGFHRNAGARLDLHWHVLRTSLGVDSDDGFWSRQTAVTVGDTLVPVLAPEDFLVNVLVHGTTGLVAPSAQWIVDAARLLDTIDVESTASRIAEVAHQHAATELCRDALDVLVAFGADRAGPVRAALDRRTPSIVERARRRGRGALVEELCAHATGGNGLRRAVFEVTRDRTDASLARHPTAIACLAATGHRLLLERWTGRLVGPLSRSAAPATPVRPGDRLDFDDAATFEAFASTGWSYDPRNGTRTRGAAGRVVMPTADVARLVVTVVSTGARIDVLVDGVRARTLELASSRQTAIEVVVPSQSVVELTLVRRGPRPRNKVRLLSISATI